MVGGAEPVQAARRPRAQPGRNREGLRRPGAAGPDVGGGGPRQGHAGPGAVTARRGQQSRGHAALPRRAEPAERRPWSRACRGRALSRPPVRTELPRPAVAARGHGESHCHRPARLHRGCPRLQYRAHDLPGPDLALADVCLNPAHGDLRHHTAGATDAARRLWHQEITRASLGRCAWPPAERRLARAARGAAERRNGAPPESQSKESRGLGMPSAVESLATAGPVTPRQRNARALAGAATWRTAVAMLLLLGLGLPFAAPKFPALTGR